MEALNEPIRVRFSSIDRLGSNQRDRVQLRARVLAAAGVDGVTWHDYEQNLEVNIANLHDRFTVEPSELCLLVVCGISVHFFAVQGNEAVPSSPLSPRTLARSAVEKEGQAPMRRNTVVGWSTR